MNSGHVPSASTHDGNTAVVSASINGFKFSCRIDSGSDKEAISDTIVKYLGDKGIFLPKRPLPVPIELKAFTGRRSTVKRNHSFPGLGTIRGAHAQLEELLRYM